MKFMKNTSNQIRVIAEFINKKNNTFSWKRKNKVLALIVLGIFLITLGVYFISDIDLKNLDKNELQVYCDSSIDIKPECVGEWILKNGDCFWECDTGDEFDEPMIGGCAGVSLENRPECCEKWAEENDIAHAMCVGSWKFQEGECAWVCDTEEDFCGTSTNKACESDADCVEAGCSGHVCAGKDEDIMTTCEFKECYNNENYGVSCGCFDGVCGWE